MAATRLGKGWFRTSLRNVTRTAGKSFILTVALVPALITQFFVVFGDEQGAGWWLGILAVLTVAVVVVFWWLELRVMPRRRAETLSALRAEDRRRITGVVGVVARIGVNSSPVASQQLIGELSDLKTFYAVECEEDVGQADALRQWLETRERHPDVHALHTRPSRYRPDGAVIERLAAELSLLPAEGLVVDITADNKLLTYVLASAAAQAGLPLTFMGTSDPTKPHLSAELIVVQDPRGFFGGVTLTDLAG